MIGGTTWNGITKSGWCYEASMLDIKRQIHEREIYKLKEHHMQKLK
jgi:hypothetical protein